MSPWGIPRPWHTCSLPRAMHKVGLEPTRTHSLVTEEMKSRAAEVGTLEPGLSKGKACTGRRTRAGRHRRKATGNGQGLTRAYGHFEHSYNIKYICRWRGRPRDLVRTRSQDWSHVGSVPGCWSLSRSARTRVCQLITAGSWPRAVVAWGHLASGIRYSSLCPLLFLKKYF